VIDSPPSSHPDAAGAVIVSNDRSISGDSDIRILSKAIPSSVMNPKAYVLKCILNCTCGSPARKDRS
jgi:hypothetical protein